MSPAHPFREVEIKLRVPDIRALKRILKRLRAREIAPRAHERNTLYDTPDQSLRRGGRLMRIRTERVTVKSRRKQPQGDLAAVLTYKAPVRPPSGGATAAAAGSHLRFKVTEESEVRVSSMDQVDQILRGLGLRPSFRYEKYRTTYLLPGIRKLKVELDETPLGNFLELEGAPPAIDRAASLLGYGPADYIRDTYGALYLADCRLRGRKPAHMLFPNGKKSR
jgi:adenylate cyclase, class 2